MKTTEIQKMIEEGKVEVAVKTPKSSHAMRAFLVGTGYVRGYSGAVYQKGMNIGIATSYSGEDWSPDVVQPAMVWGTWADWLEKSKKDYEAAIARSEERQRESRARAAIKEKLSMKLKLAGAANKGEETVTVELTEQELDYLRMGLYKL